MGTQVLVKRRGHRYWSNNGRGLDGLMGGAWRSNPRHAAGWAPSPLPQAQCYYTFLYFFLSMLIFVFQQLCTNAFFYIDHRMFVYNLYIFFMLFLSISWNQLTASLRRRMKHGRADPGDMMTPWCHPAMDDSLSRFNTVNRSLAPAQWRWRRGGCRKAAASVISFEVCQLHLWIMQALIL